MNDAKIKLQNKLNSFIDFVVEDDIPLISNLVIDDWIENHFPAATIKDQIYIRRNAPVLIKLNSARRNIPIH